MSRRWRWPLAFFVGSMLLFGSAGAVTVTLSKFPPNPGVLPGGGWKFTPGTSFGDPPPARAWVNGVYGGVPSFTATDALVLAGRAGSLSVSVARAATLKDGLTAVARCVAGMPLICGAGVVAYAAWRYKNPSDVPGSSVGSGMLDFDPGTPTTTTNQVRWACRRVNGSGNTFAFGSAQEACRALFGPDSSSSTNVTCSANGTTVSVLTLVSLVAGSGLNVFNTRTTTSVTNGSCPGFGGTSEQKYADGISNTVQVTGCPASTDPLDPQYNVPAGSPVGADGKCPTARYHHQGKTPEQAANDVADGVGGAAPTLPNQQWGDAVREAVDLGGQQIPSTITSSGPASQQGQPTTTTTTGPNGTTTTTKTPTYTYNYAGDTITYNTTNVTTINNNGTVTETTETTEGAQPDPEDPCTKEPDRIGCSKYGTPDPAELLDKEVPVTFAPDTGWGADDGQCPPPISLPNSWGVNLSFSYDATCMFVRGLRYVIIALAWVLAAYIFLGIARNPD